MFSEHFPSTKNGRSVSVVFPDPPPRVGDLHPRARHDALGMRGRQPGADKLDHVPDRDAASARTWALSTGLYTALQTALGTLLGHSRR
jgi:hypothetical protein